MNNPTTLYHTIIPPSPPTHTSRRLFHIFYTTLFYLLYTALLGLILITPGDAIHQALQNKQLYNVFVIAAAYFVTAVLAILVYASRVYTTRSVLAGIPRGYVPVEEGDVKERVRRVVKRGLGRSAGVAWLARPRAQQCAQGTNALCLAEEIEERRENAAGKRPKLAKRVLHKLSRKKPKIDDDTRKSEARRNSATGTAAALAKASLVLNPPAFPHKLSLCDDGHLAHGAEGEGEGGEEVQEALGTAIWGPIRHPGWSPPTSHDLPNLQYVPVIAELPHLVEARVVGLSGGATGENLALLTRPVSAGLREYLNLLVEVGCLDGDVSGDGEGEGEDGEGNGKVHWREWLVDYEYARFSGKAVSEERFRDLMSVFATLLRSLRGLDGQVGAEMEDEASDWDEGEAYSVYSKHTPSAGSEENSLHSKTSERSFETMDDRGSIRTTHTAGTAGTVEIKEVGATQIPSYLSSPLPATYTPAPRTPSPRPPGGRLSYLHEVESREDEGGYGMESMANTPESVIKRQPRQESIYPEAEAPPEMMERGLGGDNDAASQADMHSLRSFRTESDAGSVIRRMPTVPLADDVDGFEAGLRIPQNVRLPSSRNSSSLGSPRT